MGCDYYLLHAEYNPVDCEHECYNSPSGLRYKATMLFCSALARYSFPTSARVSKTPLSRVSIICFVGTTCPFLLANIRSTFLPPTNSCRAFSTL